MAMLSCATRLPTPKPLRVEEREMRFVVINSSREMRRAVQNAFPAADIETFDATCFDVEVPDAEVDNLTDFLDDNDVQYSGA